MSLNSVTGGVGGGENWQYDDGESINAERGRLFADSIMSASNSVDSVSSSTKPRKQYPKFRKMFWEEPIYNASIINPTRISYDQQFGEMEAHWSRAGKKFSSEPKMAGENYFEGPTRPQEFKQFSEKPLQYWGHTREVDPFKTARAYCKPLDKPINFKKLTKIEETAHLGPGVYQLHDVWLDSKQLVCGALRPSSCFQSKKVSSFGETERVDTAHTSTLRGLMQRPAAKPPRIEPNSNITHVPPGTKSTSINDLFPARDETAFIDTTSGSPGRMQSFSQVPQVGGNGQNGQNITNVASTPNLLSGYMGSDTAQSMQSPGDDKRSVGFGFEDGGASRSMKRCATTGTMPPSRVRISTAQATGQKTPALVTYKGKAGTPGFKFLQGTVKDSMVLVTGTTKSDISYRRVELNDGSHSIVSVSPTKKSLPTGSKVVPSWATPAAGVLSTDNSALEKQDTLLINSRRAAEGVGKLNISPPKIEPVQRRPRSPLTSVEQQVESPTSLPGGFGAVPIIETLTPWKPPKFQSKSHAHKAHERKLMQKLNNSTTASSGDFYLSGPRTASTAGNYNDYRQYSGGGTNQNQGQNHSNSNGISTNRPASDSAMYLNKRDGGKTNRMSNDKVRTMTDASNDIVSFLGEGGM